MSSCEPPRPLRVYLFSNPRTASNLFCKIVSQHPEMKSQLYHILFEHLFGPDAQTQIQGDAMKKMKEIHAEATKNATYQASLDRLEKFIAATESEGKIPFLKDHCCFITRTEEVQKVLTLPRTAPKPLLEDKMLDIPHDTPAGDQKGTSYHPVNPTYFPDRLMETFAPVFMIRHPAKQVESWYRASRPFGLSCDDPEFELVANFKLTRRLFEYYNQLYNGSKSQLGGVINSNGHSNGHDTTDTTSNGIKRTGRWPLVIDGDDLINDAEGTVTRFCKVIGVDPSGAIYKWERDQNPQEMMESFPVVGSNLEEAFAGTLMRSDGVKKNLSPKAPSISESAVKWEQEWGSDVAKALVKHAEDAMTDYDYLRQFAL